MKISALRIYLFTFICFTSLIVSAQSMKTVGGTIKDTEGKTIPGVSVMEKGTKNGVVSDLNGKYTINLSTNEAVLIFSFLSYDKLELKVTANSAHNVVLKEANKLLNDVVVVGYGTQIRRNVTSSISTISSEDLDEGGNNSIGQLLQGKATGLQITNTDATPGAAMRIQIRGTKSINSGTEPLWIIDGIPVNSNQETSNIRSSGGTNEINNPLANLNPDDIESIQVLKDAASTSIYGSRGANGVILVTTKEGKRGKMKTSVGFETGISEAVDYKTYVNTTQYFEMVEEARSNSGLSTGDFAPSIYDYANPKYSFFDRSYAEGVNNDWLEMFLNKGLYNKFTGSVSGGNDNTRYYVSLFQKTNEGVMVQDKRNDYGLSANLDVKVSKKLNFGIKTNLTKANFTYAQKSGSLGSRTNEGITNYGARTGWKTLNHRNLPVYPIYTPDGEYFDPYGGYSPFLGMQPENQLNDNEQYAARLISTLSYKPIKDLNFDFNGGITYQTNGKLLYISSLIRPKNDDTDAGSARGVNNRNNFLNYTFNGVANYNKKIKDFDLSFLAGTEFFKKRADVELADYEDLQSQQISIGDASAATNLQGNYYTTTDIFASFFGRINTAYKNKYLLGFTYRTDGSSVFAPQNRWGNFGSASAGWIISDEKFMQKQNIVNLLKLRASIGSTGNADIASFKWQNNYRTWPLYGVAPGLAFINIGTNNLTWEKSFTKDIGFDYGLFNNRISGSIEYYNIETKDMLLNAPIAPSTGVYSDNGGPTALLNVGSMNNHGIEFSIATTNLKSKNFTWETNFNISSVKNEVGQLVDGVVNPLQISYTPSFGGFLALNSVWTGQRLGRFYIAEYAGLDAEGYPSIFEIDNNKFVESGYTATEKTGNIIRATAANVQANRIYQNDKTGLPSYFGGLSNTFTYKNLSLDIGMVFSGGNYLYDQTVLNNGMVNDGKNVINSEVYGNTWLKGVRENAKYPIQTWNNLDNNGDAISTETTANLHKGDFLRVQNVQLTYKLPKKLTAKLNMNFMTVYANVTNLFVFSHFKSFDPEYVYYGDIHANNTDRNLGQGFIQYDPFPKARTVSIGTRISF